ncbi:hypothetical protein ABT261_48545, partial [Amycolatopsis sp. NPDC000740]
LEEAFERRAERGQAAGLWVVQHHGADGLRGWSKDGSREFRLTPAAAKHLALSAVPAGVLAQGWPVCWLMCRPEGGDARVQALHNLFAAEGFELNVPSSRGVQVSRTGVFTGLAPGAEPAPGTFALGDDAQSGQRPRNLMPARTSEPAASGSASGTGQAADPGEGRAGSGTAEEIPALEVPPDGFGPVQQLAWALLVSGAGSVAGLHAGLGAGVNEWSVREAVAKFAQRVAALAAVEGDPGQAAVLKSAAERYVAVGATGPDVDLGGELLFRRWVQGRLPAGGADERVVQALALLGHRPLTPEERERAVVTIMNVDADGNQTETQLEDKDQQMLDHVLDHGTATRRDIASAVLGETDTAAINKTRSVLDNRLDNDYHLVEKTQDGKKPVIYTARVPPPGGVVWRDVSPAGVLPKVRAHLEAHPGRGHTLTEMADAFKVYRRDSVRKALEKLVETGVASRRVEDGTVQYWLVPEELRPEAEKAKKAKKGDVRREVVEFLEAEENLGKFFTIAEIGRHTEFDETSVRSVTQRVSEVEEGEPKTIASGQKAKTFGIKTAGHARLKPGAGGKRRLEGVEGGAKRARGGVAGVGRVVSGLMDPAAAVSEGRAQ